MDIKQTNRVIQKANIKKLLAWIYHQTEWERFDVRPRKRWCAAI